MHVYIDHIRWHPCLTSLAEDVKGICFKVAGGSTDSAAMLARNVMHGYQSEVLPLRLPFITDNIRIHPKSTITIVNDLKQVYWGVQTNSRVVSRRIIRSLRVFFDNYSTIVEDQTLAIAFITESKKVPKHFSWKLTSKQWRRSYKNVTKFFIMFFVVFIVLSFF